VTSVLVVHPVREALSAIREALVARGFVVVTVPDGERAIDRFIQSPFDVLATEMVLPGRDGGTTAESIRWAPEGHRVRVVLLATRGTDADTLERTRARVRADDVYAGDVDPYAIADVIGRLSAMPLANELTRGYVVRPSSDDFSDSFDDQTLTADDDLSGDFRRGDDPGADVEGDIVEAHGHSFEHTENDLEGTLSETPFPRLLCEIAKRRGTGALFVSNPDDRRHTTTRETPKKIVYFRAGVPIYVQSNLVQECLGRVLARAGRISQEVLEESVRRVRRGDGRQGAVLLTMQAIEPAGLRDALEDQLRVKLFDLFAWTEGEYRFSTASMPPPETVTLELSLPEIVLRGVVHRIAPTRLLDLLAPHIDQYVVPNASRLAGFQTLPLAREAKAVLHGLDGSRRLRELLGVAGERPGAVAQLLYSLLCVDGIAFSDRPMPTPRLTPAAAAELDATPSLAVVREELVRLGRLLRKERYAEALDLPEGRAPADRIAELQARYRPFTDPGATPREIRALAYEVIARLTRASVALSGMLMPVPTNAGKRSKQRSSSPPTAVQKRASRAEPDEREEEPSTSREKPAPLDEPEAKSRVVETLEEGLEEDRQLTVEDPSSGRRELDGSSVEALRATIPDRKPDLEPEAAEREPSQSKKVLARTRELEASENAPRPPSAADLDGRVARLYEAERLFRRGRRALERGRTNDAVAALAQAVDLCPDEGEFVAEHAFAKFRAAADDGAALTALREIERACELAPKTDRVHVLLGLALRDRGEIDRARDAFTRALTANPSSKEARDGLDALNAVASAT
jgi:CheY-like chemotaxis protein/tetratricopeptide (TPR) repeat protein